MKNIDSLSLEAISVKYCEVIHIFIQGKCLKKKNKKTEKGTVLFFSYLASQSLWFSVLHLYILYFLSLSEHLEVIT